MKKLLVITSICSLTFGIGCKKENSILSPEKENQTGYLTNQGTTIYAFKNKSNDTKNSNAIEILSPLENLMDSEKITVKKLNDLEKEALKNKIQRLNSKLKEEEEWLKKYNNTINFNKIIENTNKNLTKEITNLAQDLEKYPEQDLEKALEKYLEQDLQSFLKPNTTLTSISIPKQLAKEINLLKKKYGRIQNIALNNKGQYICVFGFPKESKFECITTGVDKNLETTTPYGTNPTYFVTHHQMDKNQKGSFDILKNFLLNDDQINELLNF